MADFDVGVTGLNNPPTSAVLTSYRPEVSVRNNGLHNAIASGYVRIYASGLLIFETEVFSGTLTPGASGTADGVDIWTPPAEGTYIVQGYLSTPLDSVEPNNNLSPVAVIVTGGPVPPEPTVPLHAPQHEEGGTDPINVDGLLGVLSNAQTPSSHASQHQAGQSDVLNVSGLAGVLGDPQTPIGHGNAHHTPDMATSDELDNHAGSSAAHTAATNLANRNTTGPQTGLLKADQLQAGTVVPEEPADDPDAMALRFDRNMGYVNPAHHAYKHEPGGHDELATATVTSGIAQAKTCTPAGGQITIVTAELTAAQAKPGTVVTFSLIGSATTALGVGQSVDFEIFHQNGGGSTLILAGNILLAGNKNWGFHIDAVVGIGAAQAVAGTMHGEMTDTSVSGGEVHVDSGVAVGFNAPAVISRFFATVAWSGGAAGSTLTVTNALAFGVSLP